MPSLLVRHGSKHLTSSHDVGRQACIVWVPRTCLHVLLPVQVQWVPVSPRVLQKRACSGGHRQQHGRQRAEEWDARDCSQRLAEGRASKHQREDKATPKACARAPCKSAPRSRLGTEITPDAGSVSTPA